MTKISIIFSSLIVMLLGGCASPREMLGWPADVPFELTPSEKSEFATSSPVFSRRLAQVNFSADRVCLSCGDFSDNHSLGIDYISARIKNDFPYLLQQQLLESTLFPRSGDNSFVLRAKLIDITQRSSVGAAAERESPLTSGAVLTTKVSILYELLDQNQVVGSWTVTTSAKSNSLAASTRLSENIDGALKRNLRALLLRIVADYSPNDSERANKALATLQSEVDDKRIVLGYLMYGATKTVTSTAGVVGDGVSFVAQNSGTIAQGLNSTAAQMERSNREFNEEYTRNVISARQQQITGAPASKANNGTDDSGNSESSSDNQIASQNSENRNKGSSAVNGSSAQKLARCTGHQRFNDGGVEDTSSERATERSYAATKRQAEEWVSQRADGNGSVNAKITDVKLIVCDALGGNPLYRRCLIDVTYDYDCDGRFNSAAHQ